MRVRTHEFLERTTKTDEWLTVAQWAVMTRTSNSSARQRLNTLANQSIVSKKGCTSGVWLYYVAGSTRDAIVKQGQENDCKDKKQSIKPYKLTIDDMLHNLFEGVGV